MRGFVGTGATAIAAALTLADILNRSGQRCGELTPPFAIALQLIEGHALCRTRPDPGQALQSLKQLLKKWGKSQSNQNGNFIPGGRPMPAVIPEYLS